MEKDLIEEMIEIGLKKLEEIAYGEEATIRSLIDEKIKEINIKLDVNDLFEISKEIKERAEIKGIILDYSKYENKEVGLPCDTPFVKIEKK